MKAFIVFVALFAIALADSSESSDSNGSSGVEASEMMNESEDEVKSMIYSRAKRQGVADLPMDQFSNGMKTGQGMMDTFSEGVQNAANMFKPSRMFGSGGGMPGMPGMGGMMPGQGRR